MRTFLIERVSEFHLEVKHVIEWVLYMFCSVGPGCVAQDGSMPPGALLSLAFMRLPLLLWCGIGATFSSTQL